MIQQKTRFKGFIILLLPARSKWELKKRLGDLARGVPVTSKVGRIKFDELIENLCNEYQANNRRSLDVLRIRCNIHLLPFFGGRRAATITTADINRYVVKRQTD